METNELHPHDIERQGSGNYTGPPWKPAPKAIEFDLPHIIREYTSNSYDEHAEGA